MDQSGEHMKINFEYFQIQKWMLQAVWAEKVNEKMMIPSSVMVHKLTEKMQFLQFHADHSKKSKSIKEMYIYASEIYIYAYDCFLCYDLLCWRY